MKDCGFAYTHALISGKYKMPLLYVIGKNGVMRYNEIARAVENASPKALTAALRALESDGLILRKQFEQIPPRVEYSLSEKGLSLMPILQNLCDWGVRWSE